MRILIAGVMPSRLCGSVPRGMALVLAFMAIASAARGDIFEWTISGGSVVRSSTLCPDGSGVSAAPGAILESRDLTQAYLVNADLSTASLSYSTLTSAILTGANLTNALLDSANLTNANLSNATVAGANFGFTAISSSQLYSTASYKAGNLQGIGLGGNDLSGWNFSGQNLSTADLSYGTLTNANLSNATVAGANFGSTTLSSSQLYSTASYKAGNLQGIGFGGDDLSSWSFSGKNLSNADLSYGTLTNTNFTGANLTNANLSQSTLTNANLTNATVAGANFGSTTLSSSQLYSTASYKAANLQGIDLSFNNLKGWDFSGQNLSNADLSYGTLSNANLSNANLTNADLTSCNLTGANLTGVDARGTSGLPGGLAITTNMIRSDGTVQGLSLSTANSAMVVRNYGGATQIPIHIAGGMNVPSGTMLQIIVNGAAWGSTISFDPSIPVALGGSLELSAASGTSLAGLVGTSYQLFDWTGVSPTGRFTIVNDLAASGYQWDTSALYGSGNVVLENLINGQWRGTRSAMWSDSANWTGGKVPGIGQDTAVFGSALTGTATITLDTGRSLSSLGFSTTNGASYAISASGTATLTLDNLGGSATISNSGGNNTIAAPITLESNLSVSASSGGILTIAGAIRESGSGRSLTLSGNGDLILSGSNNYTGGTFVTAGTLDVTSNRSLPTGSSLTVGAGGTLVFDPSMAGSPVVSSASTVAVPEPGTLALLTAAICGAIVCQRMRSRRKK